MVDKVKSIWMEGELIAWDDAKLHLLTHTMHYGLGAFEGIRAYKRADGATSIFRLHDHHYLPIIYHFLIHYHHFLLGHHLYLIFLLVINRF